MPIVVDASVTLAWCFEDEGTPFTDFVLARLRVESAMAPAIWPLEVANALILGERRGRIGLDRIDEALDRLRSLPIVVTAEPLDVVWSSMRSIARSLRITVYDASYLDLAVRNGVPLATLGGRLRDAARRIGVPLVEPDGRDSS